MSLYGKQRYGGATYSGSTLGRTYRPDGGISVPGYDAVFYWTVAGSAQAYGQAAYGGRASSTFPSAGLFAAPDPDTLVVTIPLWWAFAQFATLTRVDATTGERTPVRDSPVALPGPSRRNAASNPKARDALTGYTAGANTTVSRIGDPAIPLDQVSTAVRATATAAGAASVALSLDPASVATTSHGFLARTSATPSSLGMSVQWFDSASGSLGTRTYAAQTTAVSGGWTAVTVTVDSYPSGAATGVVSITAGGLPAGGTLDVTARVTEVGPSLNGPYFDGDFPGASWTGTPGLSYSDISPIVYVTDAEAPLDRTVFYELSNPSAPGFVAASEAITLPSGTLAAPYDTLLTHPGLAYTVKVWVETEPEITNAIEQTKFQVIGRRNKVVVSAPQRSGDEGTLTFVTENLGDHRRLLQMLDDGSPLLIRTPDGYGHPPLWWLSFSDITIPTSNSGAANRYGDEVRRITAPFTEVDRPSAATRPLVA